MKSRQLIVALAIALAGACGAKVPPIHLPTPAPPVVVHDDPAWPGECASIWQEELGRDIDPAGLEGCIDQRRAGRSIDDVRTDVRASEEWRAKHAPAPDPVPTPTPPPAPPAQDAPWQTITRAQLLNWRGSISTTLAPMPCGPRPGQTDNVMFTAEFGSSCWPAEAKAAAIDAFRAHGWTHWPIGPVESIGYHDRYPRQDWTGNIDGFADLLEQLWRAGRIPVLFLLPDTGFCADGRSIDRACVEARLTPLYQNPRIQALARIVVLAWEPEYSADDFVWGSQWMARVFPQALRAIHLPSGHSAPCEGRELVEGGGTIANEGACWALVAPYIHLYLQQETWTFGGEAAAGRTGKQQFLYNLWDTAHRFAEGTWPGVGADGEPIRVVAFEYSSYYVTSDPTLAHVADEWGDAAVSGAPYTDPLTGQTIDTARYLAGYGDGGTLDPATVRPRFTFSLTTAPAAPAFTFTLTR